MFDTLKRGALAVMAVLAVAGCGGSSKQTPPSPPPPPAEVDLLNDAGKLDTAEAQALWHVLPPTGATVNDDLWHQGPECPSGTCAKINLSDYGTNTYSSQFALWDSTSNPAAFKTVTLRGDKQYVAKLWGKAVNTNDVAGTTHPVQFWLQKADQDTVILPSGSDSIELAADPAGTSWESKPFTYGSLDTDTAEFTVKINLGTQDVNGGTTFYLDGIQIIESAKPPPPSGTDLLAGLGSFESDPASSWFKNISSPLDKNLVDLTFSPCPVGGTGTCAVFSSTDPNGFDTTRWHSQIVYGLNGTPTAVTLDPQKNYRIALKGMVAGCTPPVTIVSWLQPNTTPNWPPVNNGTALWSLTLGATMKDATTSVFPGADGGATGFVLNLSFGTDGVAGGNAGCVFTLDDIQLIQVD